MDKGKKVKKVNSYIVTQTIYEDGDELISFENKGFDSVARLGLPLLIKLNEIGHYNDARQEKSPN